MPSSDALVQKYIIDSLVGEFAYDPLNSELGTHSKNATCMPRRALRIYLKTYILKITI